MSRHFMLSLFLVVVVAQFVVGAHFAHADYYGGGDFQGRMGSLTSHLVNVLLPCVSILGLVYAAMLAAMGDESSKSRMVLVVIACVVGFLAPLFIHWLQSATGG